ncbi:hypothetical protein [Streptacidiphilus carbonis]|uniref:hypothetical protein n=1 Tax=Streptacidiphilus carbonis TaxID=105422 RepID=UPI0005A8D861|nr:hypothetical protein [Streptacidiphilus carbonis]
MSPNQHSPDSGAAQSGSVQISSPEPDAAARGVACHFAWGSGDLRATGDVSRGEQGLVVTRVEITAPSRAGITHGLLRRVPLGDVLRFANTSSMVNDPNIVALTTGIRPARPADDYVIPPGRVLVTDELLRHVALVYLEESAPGKDRAVLQRLEERLGRPKGTVRGWVQRAREAGWLGAAVQGRMGAEPGTKLLLWLGEQMNSDEVLIKEFARLATALHADDPAAVAAGALRAWRSFGLSDFPHRTGIRPSEVYVAAEILYERTADEELAARVAAGADEDEAFDQIVAEIGERLDQAGA